MAKFNDLSRSLVALAEDSTLIAANELSRSSWLVGAVVPGLRRDPRKKLPPDADALLGLLHRWRDEAIAAGRKIERICVADEAGRDGFWLARWLRGRGIECEVIHPSSIPVSREHRRAKSDRLDLGLLLRAFLGWLRGEAKHCSMVAVPTVEEEDAKRPIRERDCLVVEATRLVNRMTSVLALYGISSFNVKLKKAPEKLASLRTAEGEPLPPNTLDELRSAMQRRQMIKARIAAIEAARLERLKQAPQTGPNAMIVLLARIVGVGIETAEMLVREVLSRPLRDRRAVARYAGLTGSPDESGSKRREQGLAKAGNARVRRGLIQLAWRLLTHQSDCELVKWYRERTVDGRGITRKVMMVAVARKLLIALWEYVASGKVPPGMRLHPAV
ncbi:MAG TPA: IS110 family transposase [Acetobacteraceae bacterium]|nr:IS110 family transposase [Acetobacteraceae bacterium]